MELRINRAADFLAWGAGLTTVFILTGVVSDPVNSTKLFIAGAFAGALLLVVGLKGLGSIWASQKWFCLGITSFLLFSLLATFLSPSPLVQNLYGVYGRNTGFLAYLTLSIFAISSALLNSKKQIQKLLIAFFCAGVLNLTYGLWVSLLGDFVAWNNIYGNLLGTFGNPNFMGSFLGMLFGLIFVYTITPEVDIKFRILGLLLLIITFYEITETKAVQGIVLSAGSVFLGGVFWIWKSLLNRIFLAGYLIFGSLFGLTSILGALQIGPLSDFIYKRSVSLRGAYWHAGLEMGLRNPFSGVGMDGYGNWYRRTRSLGAVIDTPGAEVTTNAAHNVFIDLFASGGFPLLISYLMILFISLSALIKLVRYQNNYDPLVVSLFVIWICYHTQAVISINQIGLAIWGWVLTGAIVALERIIRDQKKLITIGAEKKVKKSQNIQNPTFFDSSGLRAFAGLVLGAIVCVPPFTADAAYQSALNSKQVSAIENALQSNYFKPTDSFRLANSVQIFDSNNLSKEAIKYARIGIKFNPDYTDAWKMMYYASGATKSEKFNAKQQLIRLDPLNNAWKELK